jgi:hypothetical protein
MLDITYTSWCGLKFFINDEGKFSLCEGMWYDICCADVNYDCPVDEDRVIDIIVLFVTEVVVINKVVV